MLTDALILIALGVLALLLPLSSAYRSSLTGQLVGWSSAHVPPAQRETIERRLTRRAQGAGAGILVAGLLALVLRQVWDGADKASGGFFMLSVLFVMGAVGLVVADIWWPGDVPEGARTARMTSPELADYLPSTARLLGRVLVVLGLLALVGTLLLGRTRWFDAATILGSPVPWLAVAVPVLAGLTWLATRRLLDVPQPARDEQELYWQDLVRARTLGSLHTLAPLVSMFGVIVCGSVLDDAASAAAIGSGELGPGWSLWVLIAGYLLPVLVVVGAAAVILNGRSEADQVRSRLWSGRPRAGAYPSPAGAPQEGQA